MKTTIDGHANLAGQQNVLAGLRHRTIRRTNHEDRSVHLGRAGNHVLHVVGMAGTIDMRIVALISLVFDVSRIDRNATLFFFRGRVDFIVLLSLRLAGFRKHGGNRRRERSLAVINMADRANVDVRFGSLELFFCHL